MMKKQLLLAAFAALSLAACGKKEPTPSPKSAVAATQGEVFNKWFNSLPPKAQVAWREGGRLVPLREAQSAKDRKELVRPAPPGFKPENLARKIKLTLVPQKTMLRVGDHFWYRLELQNVAKEPISWRESRSFFKSGAMYANFQFDFHVTPPGGNETQMLGPHPLPHRMTDIKFPAGWTDQQKTEAIRGLNDRQRIEDDIGLTLAPGEILVTRPWRNVDINHNLLRDMWIRGEPDPHSVPGPFRELPSRYWFSKPGTYRIKVIFDDESVPAPKEQEIQELMKEGVSRESQLKYYKGVAQDSFGRVESNTVKIEVVP
jgi:predicted small lipoprotein YifL